MSEKHVSPSPILSLFTLFISEATVEADLLYMVQPSRMYFGDNINVFSRGKLNSIHTHTHTHCYMYVESLS